MTIQRFSEADEDRDDPLRVKAADALRTLMEIRSPFACEEYSLRRRLRALCLEARRANLPPQQLRALFELVWWSLPEARTATPARSGEIIERVLEICSEEYHAASFERAK